MITTVKSNLTWDGKMAEVISKTSEKKLKQTLKDITGAIDVDIIDVNSWSEDDEDETHERSR